MRESERNNEELVDETNEIMSMEEMVVAGRLEEEFRELMVWNSTRFMCCTERAFCVTRGGYMGMVPPGSREGEGSLRRRVRLVGEAYMHDIMDREVMGGEEGRKGDFEVV